MENKDVVADMVMSVLEAHVAEEHWSNLKQTYQGATGQLPPPLVQTFLVQSADDPTLWRIITVWRSREALEEYRRSVEVPGGILIFRSVDAEPTLSLYDVAASMANVERAAP